MPGRIGFVWHDQSRWRRRQLHRPLPTAVRAVIGFVLPRLCVCLIRHNSSSNKYLPVIAPGERLALFRTIRSESRLQGALRRAGPRPDRVLGVPDRLRPSGPGLGTSVFPGHRSDAGEIGFVSHDGAARVRSDATRRFFVGWASPPDFGRASDRCRPVCPGSQPVAPSGTRTGSAANAARALMNPPNSQFAICCST